MGIDREAMVVNIKVGVLGGKRKRCIFEDRSMKFSFPRKVNKDLGLDLIEQDRPGSDRV